jgi:hypothetical protein
MAEIWKPVPRYPGLLASSEGRLLLQPRYTPMNHGGYRAYLPKPFVGVKRKAQKAAAHEYYGFWCREYGNVKVHQAVCEAFHGPKPFDRAVVIHKDENALNNKPENLKWGTQKENLNAPGFKAYCRSDARKMTLRAANRNAADEVAA